MKKIVLNFTILISILTILCLNGNAQTWGEYTLIAKQGSTSVKLVSLDGTTYKSWTLTGNTGYSCFLTPDRCLIRIVGGSGGNAGSKIEKINWDGQVVWTFNVAAHHDICYMPNGNVLAAVLTTATSAELAQIGLSGTLKYDKIVEIDGVNGQIVWEWRFIDHTVQNTNSSLSNFGTPSAMPHRFNTAVQGSMGYNDWQHLNGIDYYPQRDQIVFSCKALQEIFVIDHSTTTAEAKTGAGGLSGKGGDFLYRWGKPSNYGLTGGLLGTIHDAAWGLGETYQAQSEDPTADNYHVYAKMISVWSNTNIGGMCIEPPYITNSFLYDFTSGTAFLPSNYYRKLTLVGNSTNMGGNQLLPNGNMLLFAGAGASTAYEKNSSGTTVWSNATANGCSKVTRYSTAYVNGDYVTICATVPIGDLDTTTQGNGINEATLTKISFKNPVYQGEILNINQLENSSDNLIELFDLTGKLIYRSKGTTQMEVPYCETGIYLLKINGSSFKIQINK
jgi:hypothetical protein